MKNAKPLLILQMTLPFLLLWSCTKQGPIGPQGQQGNANVTSVTFTNISVPLNGTYVFNIPAITQAILDSGTVSVYYSNPAITPEQWFPLPQYFFYNGNLVWLILYNLELGKATLSDSGITSFRSLTGSISSQPTDQKSPASDPA
jgi:hypothetical protein